MARNDNAPYSANLTFLESSAAAFGVVQGGSFEIGGDITRNDGIGMQSSASSGIVVAQFSADIMEPTAAILSGMIRASATHSVVAKTFELGTYDSEWTLTDCQPTGFTVRLAVGEPMAATVGFMATSVAQAASGPYTQATVTGLGDKWSDIDCTIDGTRYCAQSIDITMDAGAYAVSCLGTKSVGSKRQPTNIRLGNQNVTLNVTLANQIGQAATSIYADTFDEDIDVVLTGGNSSTVFTLSNLGTPNESQPFSGGGDLQTFTYSFPALAQLGAISIA